MKRLRHPVLVLLIFLTALTAGIAEGGDERDTVLVGRIAYTEGKILRYVDEEKDWVVTVRDAPFGLEDALYAGEDARAEFIMPNRTWLRIGNNTQIQLIDLNPEATTVDVASGLARFYNKSEESVIKVTTPFGYVVGPADTAFDVYVGDQSLEVIAVRGDIDFVHQSTLLRYAVAEGSYSLIADRNEVAGSNGTVDAAWDDWNEEREELWAKRREQSRSSVKYLPAQLHDEAYALDENGRWERVYYEGEYHYMWRPTRIERGWRPFTAGRWTVYYEDHCWVPDETFGYVTHHYGSWVYVASFRSWYWRPPVARFVADRPRVFVSFSWHPGRVGWIHSGRNIGWVPLAPDEEYYGHRHWGPRTVVVRPKTEINININIVNYRFIEEAVVIPRDRFFYRGSRYTPFVHRDVGRDVIINNYKPTTIINNTVINNYSTDQRRFAFSEAEVTRKPHVSVTERISANSQFIRDIERVDREQIRRDLTRLNVQAAPPPPKADVPPPVVTAKLVEPEKASRPLETLSLEKKEIKPKDRQRQIPADREQRRRLRDPQEGGAATREAAQTALDIEQENRRPAVPQDPQTTGPGMGQTEQTLQPGQEPQEKPGPRSPREIAREREEGRSQGQNRQPRPPREQEAELRQTKEDRPRQPVAAPDGPQPEQTLQPGLEQTAQPQEKSRPRSPREIAREREEGRPQGQNRQPRPPREQEAELRQTKEDQRQPVFAPDGPHPEQTLQPEREQTAQQENPKLRSPREITMEREGGRPQGQDRRSQEKQLRGTEHIAATRESSRDPQQEQASAVVKERRENSRVEQDQARQRQQQRDAEAQQQKQRELEARRQAEQDQARQRQQQRDTEAQQQKQRELEARRQAEQDQARQRQQQRDAEIKQQKQQQAAARQENAQPPEEQNRQRDFKKRKEQQEEEQKGKKND